MIELSTLNNHELEAVFLDRLTKLFLDMKPNQYNNRWGIFFNLPTNQERIAIGTQTVWSNKGSASKDLWEFIGNGRWSEHAFFRMNNEPVAGAPKFKKVFGPLINKYIEIRPLKDGEF